jgi:hypothetical protein
MSHLFHITSLPLHINQYSYQVSQNDSYLIIETLSQLVLPPNPEDGKAILIVNVSEQVLSLETNDGVNKIYNNLYAPNGSFEVEIDANRMIYLIFVINISTNQGKWLTHLG